MRAGPLNLDEYALVNILKAFSGFKPSNHGREIHTLVVKLGFCRFTVLVTALMHINLKCGNLKDACKLFDELSERDVVSWTSLVVGYVQHQLFNESLVLFRRMITSGVIPNGYSFSGALSACSGFQAFNQGKQIHAQVVVSGIIVHNPVLRNNLISMYSKCHKLQCARQLFDSMPVRCMISWNEMASGYVQWCEGEEALKLISRMNSEGIKPDKVSYAIYTKACADLASMGQGTQIHGSIIKIGFQSDLVISNALIDMYAKCGCISSAKLIFDLSPFKDTVLWTSMISAYGKYGLVDQVYLMFEQMRELNIKPDQITYLALLSACSHSGLVNQGWHYFKSMTENNSISAEPEHYACMVDLLCRSGLLAEALSFIKQMPLKPTITVWSAFLSSCRLYDNIELAQVAANELLELDHENHSAYIALSNMHAVERNWKEIIKIRANMKNKKEPGCSWIEVKNVFHAFHTADRSHPEMCEILWILHRLNSCL